MWFDPQRPDALNNIRHNAQERDGMYLKWHHDCAYAEHLCGKTRLLQLRELQKDFFMTKQLPHVEPSFTKPKLSRLHIHAA